MHVNGNRDVHRLMPAGGPAEIDATTNAADRSLRFGVLLVDNRDIVHVGLRVLLHGQSWVTRVISARRGADAVLLAARHEPRVAIVDLFVGDEYGVNICRAIRARMPNVRVLLTSSSTTLTQHAARVAGAAGFIAKDCAATELLAAVRAVAADTSDFVWRPEVARGLLSVRQQEILNLMAEGYTNHRIADAVGLSVDTVKHHTTLIYRRLEVPNRAAAVHLAQQLGLLTPGNLAVTAKGNPFASPAQPVPRAA